MLDVIRHTGDEFEENTMRENFMEDIFDKWIEEKASENPLEEDKKTFSKETLLNQLNGVDPLTIQKQLEKAGEYLTIDEIIKLIED